MTDIEVHAEDAAPECGRCAQPGLLAASIPYLWDTGDGQPILCHRTSVLCAVCDRGNPDAVGLLALLTLHERLDESHEPLFRTLVRDWVAAEQQRTVDPAVLDEEEARWRAGDL